MGDVFVHKLRAWLRPWSLGEAECGRMVQAAGVTTWWSQVTCSACQVCTEETPGPDLADVISRLLLKASELDHVADLIQDGTPVHPAGIRRLARSLRDDAEALQRAFTAPGAVQAPPPPERPA